MGFLTGELPCPLRPTQPVEPVLHVDASEAVMRKASADYDDAMESFQSPFAARRTWIDEDARETAIIVASMEVHLSAYTSGLDSAQKMWSYLQ